MDGQGSVEFSCGNDAIGKPIPEKLVNNTWLSPSVCYNQTNMYPASDPQIVVFSEDKEFLAQTKQCARQAGFGFLVYQTPTVTDPNGLSPAARVFAEPLSGPEARLIADLSDWQPALILFDLDATGFPWKKWVALIKSVSATRRQSLVCISANLPLSELLYAQELGADGVYPKVYDQEQVAGWIARHASLIDNEQLAISCHQPLSTLAVHGLQLFNFGEYFEAHEVLEEAWNQDNTPAREMYRAILQIAVAYLQIERGNYQGAVKMFLRVRQWMQPLPDTCRGVDIAQLRQDSQKVYEQLISLGRDRLDHFDRSLFKPVRYQELV